MDTFNLYEAKTRLSDLVERAAVAARRSSSPRLAAPRRALCPIPAAPRRVPSDCWPDRCGSVPIST